MLFVATAEAGDEEMQHRIEKHKEARPTAWRTIEVTTHVGKRIRQEIAEAQVVIVDCITLLGRNGLGEHIDPASDQINSSVSEEKVAGEIDELIECISLTDAAFIVITNEIGLGLVPVNRIGRLYRDLLGCANQRLAEVAEEVYMMVVGLPVQIKPTRHSSV